MKSVFAKGLSASRSFVVANSKALGFSALALAAMTASAHAGTSGDEFQEAYEMMTGWIEGFFGRAIALAFLVVGLFMGIARQNLMACGVAIVAAFGLVITPTVLNNILAVSLSPDTMVVEAVAIDLTETPVVGAQ